MSGMYVTSPDTERSNNGFTPMEHITDSSSKLTKPVSPRLDDLIPIPDPTLHPSTPYIRLKAKLSRVYITHTTVFLLLLLFSTFSTLSSIHSQTSDMKSYIKHTCTSLESSASRTANLPQELISRSISFNVRSINIMVRKLSSLVSSALDMFSDLILFFLNAWKQLLRCLMGVVLDGSLKIVRDQAKQITEVLQKIATGITKSVNTIMEAGDRLLDALNKIDFLNIIPDGTSRLPRIEMLKVPDGLEGSLKALSVATFDGLDQKFEGLIAKPFQIASDALKNVSGKDVVSETQFTKPPMRYIGFCNDIMDVSVLDKIEDGMNVVLWTCIVFLFVLIVVSVGTEIYRVRKSQEMFDNHIEEVVKYAAFTNGLVISKETVEGIYHELEKPWYNRISRFLATTQKTRARQVKLRWALDYVYHPPSWLCLGIGALGCFVAASQWSTLNRIEREDIPQFVQKLQAAETVIGEKTNVRVGESLEGYMTKVNLEMEETVNQLNEQLFGPVQSLSRNTSQTITAVIEETMHFLKETLKLDIFGNLVDRIYFCLLGVKIDNVQRFLGVLSEMKIDMPPPLKADMFRFDVNATSIVNSNALVEKVVGVPTVDPNSGTVIYSGGLVTSLLKTIRERTLQSLYTSAFLSLFGALIFAQTAIVLMTTRQ